MEKLTNTLSKFWLSLSDNTQTRARMMQAICAEADVSYQHVRLVINRKRSLSIDAADRLYETIKKRGGNVKKDDLLIPISKRR